MTTATTSPTAATPEARTSPLAVGDTAPDFTLQNQDRADWKLADAVKKGPVVLCFFPFAYTGVCGTEMKCISHEMAQWTKKGITVVGISCDSPFTLKSWAQAEGFQHTLLSDQHRAVCKSFGIYWPEVNTTRRATVILDKSPDGKGKVKHIEVREPGDAMNFKEILATIS